MKVALSQRLFPKDLPPRLLLIFFAIAVQCLAAVVTGAFEWFEEARTSLIALGIVGLRVGGFLLILAMAKAPVDAYLRSHKQRLLAGAKVLALLLVILSIGEGIGLTLSIFGIVETPALNSRWSGLNPSDRVALSYHASQLLLEGQNPYAHSNIILALEDFPETDPTPLQQGAFAEVYPYPSKAQLEEALEKAQAHPDVLPLEFNSKVSYPAGSFLFHTPLVALGLSDIRLFHLLCALVMIAFILWQVPASLRPLVFIAAIANLELWNIVLAGTLDVLWGMFFLLGWSLRRRPWLSAVFIGLAATCKQTSWFFILFYLVLLVRQIGWRRSLQSLAIIGAVFSIINIPFIISAPQAWLEGMLVPILAPMFPQGSGLITLSLAGLLPQWPRVVYGSLEVMALVAALVWYYYRYYRFPQAGLLLAVVPLFFAWRSFPSYFSLIPILVFGAVIIEEYKKPRLALSR